jgi:hypothetical protein
MISVLRKPVAPRPIFSRKKLLPERKSRTVTIAAGFRCPQGGVLLCADREEDNGYNKREVDKIYRVPATDLQVCDVWLAGAGGGDLIRTFQSKLHASLVSAFSAGQNVFDDHESLVQAELAAFHRQRSSDIKKYGFGFVVVVSPLRPDRVPLLYRTDGAFLTPQPQYCAVGTGQPISDYLCDRLFEYGKLESRATGILAAFILREAQNSASGVGLGSDMVFIHEGGKTLYFIGKDKIAELQSGIPPLKDCIYSYWPEHVIAPTWYKEWW